MLKKHSNCVQRLSLIASSRQPVSSMSLMISSSLSSSPTCIPPQSSSSFFTSSSKLHGSKFVQTRLFSVNLGQQQQQQQKIQNEPSFSSLLEQREKLWEEEKLRQEQANKLTNDSGSIVQSKITLVQPLDQKTTTTTTAAASVASPVSVSREGTICCDDGDDHRHKNNVTTMEKQVEAEMSPSTTPMDICNKFLSRNFAKDVVSCRINGRDMWDVHRPLGHMIKSIEKLEFFTFEQLEGMEVFWHSSAHLLGCALESEFENSGLRLCDGPALINRAGTGSQQLISGGFFYESYLENDAKISSEDFAKLERKMNKFMSEKHPFERLEVSRDFAKKIFQYNRFKLDIIKLIPKDQTITLYKCGSLIDLCRGPHVPHTGFIKAFKLNKTSGAYWGGLDSNPILQRVYGISFPNATMLKEWETRIEEAAKRDHRLIGRNQDLFVFHEWSPGSPFFLPHGTRLFNRFLQFLRKQYELRGYHEVVSPQMFNKELWETSGHWEHYKEDMYTIGEHEQEHHHSCAHHVHSHHEVMGLKPMNCPGHCLMFGTKARSYRDLPTRWADFSPLHRNEAKGSLTGLTRVRRFHQDDAHIFCTADQVQEEIRQCLDFVKYVYSIFDFKLLFKLSTRPEKFVGSIDLWDNAEESLKQCLNNLGERWVVNEGDGAFYGPKIDISIEDSLQRQHQCATIQLDFQLPQRFNLKYQAQDGTMQTPVIIHRAILGSIERFMALLTEHIAGKWPFWLSPRQCVIVPVSEKFATYAKQVEEAIHAGSNQSQTTRYYVDVDESEKTLKKKIRDAQLSQYNYILVVGEQEMNEQTVNVRARDGTTIGSMTIPNLLERFNKHVTKFE